MVSENEKENKTMDFFEAVEKRASYRSAFADKEIPEADIRKIVTAGLHAPSGYNFQTTSFVVVRDPEIRAKLAALLPTPATKTAPVILAAVSEQKINEEKGAAHFAFDTQDYAASVENIMLAIVAMGYAGVWMDGMSRMHEADKEIAKILNVPDGKWVRSIIPFGIPTVNVPQREKKSFDERVVWDRF